MNVERFLREYPILGDELMRLNKELNNLIMCKEDNYNTLKAQNITDMPRSATPEDNPSSVEKAVIRLMDIEQRFDIQTLYYTNRINDLIEQKRMFEEVWATKELLTKFERRVIELRCFIEYDWATVSRLTNYSRTSVIRVFESAVSKIERRMDELAS